MASPPEDAQETQETQAPPQTRRRPSLLIDIAVALLFLAADAVIVVVAAMLLLMIGMGTAPSPDSSGNDRSRDVPVLMWLFVWGVPALAVTHAVVQARMRMPVSAVVQSLFAITCTLLAVAWTRMLLS